MKFIRVRVLSTSTALIQLNDDRALEVDVEYVHGFHTEPS